MRYATALVALAVVIAISAGCAVTNPHLRRALNLDSTTPPPAGPWAPGAAPPLPPFR